MECDEIKLQLAACDQFVNNNGEGRVRNLITARAFPVLDLAI
jgi:hypothetical protein